MSNIRRHIAARLTGLADRIDPKGAPLPTWGIKIVHDEDHETDGSYALGSDEEDARAGAEERAKLESGEWVALGMIAMQRCGDCGEARESDKPADLWGIVVTSGEVPDWAYPDIAKRDGALLWGEELDELGPYLREIANEIIAEARS